jgi:phosphatidylserine/phosphatidylglycerophosphate/cardiolipin synthase-like enzyme
VTASLTDVADTTLERLLAGLKGGQLRAPLLRSDLDAFGVKGQLDALVATLEGHSREATLSILSAVLAERRKLERPAPELVWTGPEGDHALARDTAVVLRELFEAARERVVLAGYSFGNAEDVLGPLHVGMRDHHVKATFFVDVPQAPPGAGDPETYGQSALARFLHDSWPFGPPFPTLYCDRRALRPGPPWSSMHAKCVAVDGRLALVSSANFTTRGQERNIETGVLIDDRVFASQLERQWLGLIEGGLVYGYVA